MGWLDIEMVEIAQKRIEVRRERVGLHEEGVKGANVTAATVDEAIVRLREIEGRFRTFHDETKKFQEIDQQEMAAVDDHSTAIKAETPISAGDVTQVKEEPDTTDGRKLLQEQSFKKGRLIHRTEPELKSHTSYLVFALLPQEWTAEDEEAAKLEWPVEGKVFEKVTNHSHRARKRAERAVREAAAKAASEQQPDQVEDMAEDELAK